MGGRRPLRVRPLLATALVAGLVACGGGSPTRPSGGTSPGAATGGSLEGSIVGALDDLGIPGLSLRVASGASTVSGEDGAFALPGVPAGLQIATASGGSIVTRQTGLTAPGSGLRLPVIPAAFDLACFDQMMRSEGRLQRWTTPPRLVIVSRVLRFTTTADNEFVALADEMDDAEIAGLVADLADGFTELTAGRLGPFAGTSIERPSTGSRVPVKRQGSIVVARHAGLTAATSYWGYGRWATSAAAEVVGGIVFLDRDFERSGSQFRRSLRVHELGHALGYMHVTLCTSVMNSSADVMPNDWDRQSVRIAFQRPPGNRSPDTDPSSYSLNTKPIGRPAPIATWGPWIH